MIEGDPLPGDFLIDGHLRDGATKKTGHSPATAQDPARIDRGDGTQSRLAAITDVIIDTTTVPFCYSVLMNANPAIVRDLQPGTVTVVVAIEVISGKVGIAWIDKQYQTLDSTELHVEAAPGVQRVSVLVPSDKAHSLILRNVAGDSMSSSFRLFGFSAVSQTAGATESPGYCALAAIH